MSSATTSSGRRVVSSLKGSCLCGAIAWKVENIQLAQVCVCHCGMCRRLSGSTYIPFGAVERSKLWPVFDNNAFPTLKSYQSSPVTTRYFCGTCSSPVVFDYNYEPNTLWVPLGSLQELDPAILDETRDGHIFVKDQAEYETCFADRLKEFPGFGLYKKDPCQPADWKDIPTLAAADPMAMNQDDFDEKKDGA